MYQVGYIGWNNSWNSKTRIKYIISLKRGKLKKKIKKNQLKINKNYKKKK